MARYYGEGTREVYWERNGRWYHLLSNGRSFFTLEAAKRAYQLYRPVGWADTPIGAFTVFIFFVLFVLICRSL
jgi:hypothetical protein